MDEPSVRPPDFDLAAYWAQSAELFQANLPRYYATLRLSPEMLLWMRAPGRGRVEHSEPADAEGWTRVRIRFDVEEQAIQLALAFGANAEVVEPPELRAKVMAAAEATVSFYRSRNAEPG